MLRTVLIFLTILLISKAKAQYAPAVGQFGSTAINKDSSIIHNWATACNIEKGWINIADTSLGKTNNGSANNALGKADNSTISLGDGGIATVSFTYPIINGPSWDFAVFENSFDDFFLELAFVEVSSDGQNFFRFPAHSITQTSSQIGGFGQLEAAKINNLAGKYRGGYGTPFDLNEMVNISGLDINKITHIRIIDVVGSIDTAYGSIDTAGNMINDPFPTPFPSSGFDLDAVGIIHQVVGIENSNNNLKQNIKVYPNPTIDFLNIETTQSGELIIYSQMGKIVYKEYLNTGNNRIDVGEFSQGVYFGVYNNSKFKIIILL